MEVKVGYIDPKDYPFRKWIEEQKHLDTDELRHTMKSFKVNIGSLPDPEKYCAPEQLDAEGRYRRPKKLIEAERRGFKSVVEMDAADKKAEEEKKAEEAAAGEKLIQTLTERSQTFEAHARDLEEKLAAATAAAAASAAATETLRRESEARFNKLAEIVSALAAK